MDNKGEFKRGWPVLLACFLGVGVSLVAILYYSWGIWIKPWQDEFGWSRGEIGLGQGLSTAMIVLGAPFAGALIDRYGLKRTATLSLLFYGSLFFAFTKMNGTLWMYYLLSMMTAIVALPSTPIGFTRAINAWFHKNKGKALGICLTSTGLSAFLLPKFITPYVATHGWRPAVEILTLVILAATPFIWFFIKDRPDASVNGNDPTKIENGLTIREASRSSTFWNLALVFLLISIGIVGLIPSFIPMLQDAGLDAGRVGSYAAILGASVMIGRLLTGVLIDYIFAPHVVAVVFTLVAIGCFLLGWGGVRYAIYGAIALGLGIGAEVDLIGYFTAKYFGLRHYGSIYGAMYSIFSLGAILSPAIAGYIWDRTGDYNVALFLATGLITTAIILTFFLPRFPADYDEALS